ncbi:prostaglandin reductase 3-like [Bradysia coprophila]|uniref:prostaglandin reductase 3-like n=1 Tax=Bradysia coprophila TaxID=38358 RepID=UPI00187DB790|nr:prostaglandin reductase 3-like [Bradysia coprophila]XP_037026633.1 prostaglandin reductase 3-like [Bradysia coprophila]
MATFKKLQVTNVTADFRKATSIFELPIPKPGSDQILVKNHFSGVNAADLNVTAARYFTVGKVPFDIGFESLGVVEAVGEDVTGFKVGQAVMSCSGAGYSEYQLAEAKELIPIPAADPKYISVMVCGLSAAIGLDYAGNIKAGDKVLITAAAGGTGHIAVQWAKSKGAYVIGTTSSADKVTFLKGIGADHVINYKEEDLNAILKRDYPDGVNVIWETIGGKVTETLIPHLASFGRMILIGGIAGYRTEGFPKIEIQPSVLLMNDITLTGFFLLNHVDKFPVYLNELIRDVDSGKLNITNDFGENTSDGIFSGLNGAVRGVEHLHSGKSIGKVTIKLC